MLKKIGLSISLQMLGTISSFLLVWLITRQYGTAVQGQFALIKSWIDLSLVVACFGLPQSFVYALNQLKIPLQKLRDFTLKYMIVIFPISIVGNYIWFEYAQKQYFLKAADYVFIAIAVTLLTAHGLFRGLLLTRNDGKIFAIVTALPAIGLFLSVSVNFILFKQYLNLPVSYTVSSLIAFACVFFLLSLNNDHVRYSVIQNNNNTVTIPWKTVFNNGFSVFIQGLAIVLLPLCTYWLMARFGFSQAQIGLLNIALYSYMIVALPLNMVAPLFFNRWSKISDVKFLEKDVKRFSLSSLALIPVLLILYWAMPHLLTWMFGYQVMEIIPTAQILIFAMLPLYLNNIYSCAITSRGHFRFATLGYSLRTIFCLALIIFLFIVGIRKLEAIAISWVVAEYLLFCCLLFFRKKT